MTHLHRLPVALLMLCLATVARGLDIAPVSDPEALGFSSSRLARIGAWQQSQVDAGAFSGAVAAIARNGKVAYLRAVGFRDHAKTIPLQPDAIFWIASMTKPVTSVGAMMLVEEGKLDLAAPVRQYLPELKEMMVGVETTDPASGQSKLALEPQKRPMTVEDLLRHTSGVVYEGQGNTAVHKLYRENGLYEKGLARDSTLKDFVSRLARLPLAHQPGEVFEYGHSSDLDGSSRSYQASRSTSFSTADCSNRSAWSTPPSGCRRRSAPVCSTLRLASGFLLLIETLRNRPRYSRAAVDSCPRLPTTFGSARCC